MLLVQAICELLFLLQDASIWPSRSEPSSCMWWLLRHPSKPSCSQRIVDMLSGNHSSATKSSSRG